MKKFAFSSLLILSALLSEAQPPKTRFRERNFQLSFFPGVSTNGLESGHYFNRFSLNLFSGISAGNHHLEIGTIANINTRSSTGIQLAGLANIIGSNAYYNLSMADELAIIEEGFSSDLKGIQLSGLLNFVRNNTEGIQLTGGVNFNNGYMHGFQLAGLSNMAGKQVFGVQIAGLYNVAVRGMTGAQVSALFNYTYGELAGLQLGLINRAMLLEGKNSASRSSDRGFQIGLVNIGREMDGVQLGLINIARATHGVQLGLINFFHPSPYKGSSVEGYGVPVGLLNFGSSGAHMRLYADEIFLTVLERTTGNCQNCTFTPSQMPFTGSFKIVNQNALIFGYNPWPGYNSDIKWGFGYGFMKVFYNKSSMIEQDLKNGRILLSSGLRLMHLNRTTKFDKSLSLLARAHVEAGLRLKGATRFLFQQLTGNYSPQKLMGRKGAHLIAGVSFNTYLHNSTDIRNGMEILRKREKGTNLQYWPGFSFGLQF